MVAKPKPQKQRASAKCRNCKETFAKRRDWQVFCKPKCRDDYNNRHRVSCFYCGGSGPFHRDHVDPVSRTGKKRNFTIDEWVWACVPCNGILRASTQSSIQARLAYVKDGYIKKLQAMKPVKWDIDELNELGPSLKQYVESSLQQEIAIMRKIRFAEVRSALISKGLSA